MDRNPRDCNPCNRIEQEWFFKDRVCQAEVAWRHDRYILIIYHFCRVHLEKSNVSQLVTKFFPIYLTQSSLQVSKFPSTLPIQRHLNPLHNLFHFLNIEFNITSSSKLESSKWPLSLRISKLKSAQISLLTLYAKWPVQINFLMNTKNYLVIYTDHWDPQYIILSISMAHLSLRSIYFPQYPNLKHHQITFLPQCERRNFTAIKPKKTSLYFSMP